MLSVQLNGHELSMSKYANGVATYDVDPAFVKPLVNKVAFSAKKQITTSEKVILSGRELLAGDNQPPWRRLFPANGQTVDAESIVDEAYRFHSDGKGPVNLLYPFSGMNGQDVELHFQTRTEAGATPGSNSIRIANGKSIEVIDFIPGRVRLRYSAHQCDFDTESFHHYAVTLSQGHVTLSADGKPLLAGEIGNNAGNANCYLTGYHFTIPGMQEASLTIGALDKDANGVGFWKDLTYRTSSLSIEDLVLTVTFPHKPSEELSAVAHKDVKEWLVNIDCADGVFPNHPLLQSHYPPLKAAPNGRGVLFNNDIGEYNSINLKTIPELDECRFMMAEWQLDCIKPPRAANGFVFQTVLQPHCSKPGLEKYHYAFYIRHNNGSITTPFGTFDVPEGTQSVRAVIDNTNGEVILMLDGKVIASSFIQPTDISEPQLYFGDGSSLISGQIALTYYRIALF